MISLVGSTGFVGGNLAAKGSFDGLYHSTNIQEAFGTCPDVLYYAGLRAEKFLAEQDPERDLADICKAQENIRKIAPKRLVLISTIEVYADPLRADEDDQADGNGAYGANRARMEEWVMENFSDYLIVRLPGLFGKGIKKNFIYDFIQYVPKLLTPEKFSELSAKDPALSLFYALNDRNFYQLRDLSAEEKPLLRKKFEHLGFSALNFTDSEGVYQYYDLSHLYNDISAALAHNIKTLNISTEPVSIREIFFFLTGNEFENRLPKKTPYYDFRTRWFNELGGFAAEDGKGGYLYRKEEVLKDIKTFTDEEMQP